MAQGEALQSTVKGGNMHERRILGIWERGEWCFFFFVFFFFLK